MRTLDPVEPGPAAPLRSVPLCSLSAAAYNGPAQASPQQLTHPIHWVFQNKSITGAPNPTTCIPIPVKDPRYYMFLLGQSID